MVNNMSVRKRGSPSLLILTLARYRFLVVFTNFADLKGKQVVKVFSGFHLFQTHSLIHTYCYDLFLVTL